MRSPEVDLSRFENSFYNPGRSWLVRTLWFAVGLPLLRCQMIPSSSFRRFLLRLFGCEVGDAVVIKPGCRIKYPWNLMIGNNCWIGEDSWIDNLTIVSLEDNVCISQGAYLCTGNHDWSDPAFGLVVQPIRIASGAWVGARASITPGRVVGECAVVGFGSVVTADVPPYEIHLGNPAKFIRHREIRVRQKSSALNKVENIRLHQDSH